MGYLTARCFMPCHSDRAKRKGNTFNTLHREAKTPRNCVLFIPLRHWKLVTGAGIRRASRFGRALALLIDLLLAVVWTFWGFVTLFFVFSSFFFFPLASCSCLFCLFVHLFVLFYLFVRQDFTVFPKQATNTHSSPSASWVLGWISVCTTPSSITV